MKYLEPELNDWACDIEADNLLDRATRIWCVCVEHIISGVRRAFTSAEEFHEWLKPEYQFVGHNFLSYDAPMLNRHWKAGIGVGRIKDSYILSQLYDPSLPRPKGLKGKKQSHSLEAWGLRLKCEKGDFDDFSKFTPEMLEYCAQDTRLTALLFRKLSARMRQYHFSEEGCEIEHLAWHIIQNKQRRNGFPFDVRKAEGLYVELRARQEQLEREIHKLWPPELLVVKEFAKADRKDGSPSADFLRHAEQYPKLEKLESGGYRAYDWVSFNLASPPQRLAKLLTLGWVPTKLTKKTAKGGGGTPQVDEDELLAFAETSGTLELVALAKWLVVSSRANMIRTWLDAVNPETGAIHGKLFLASTLRYKHSAPNSANIPAVRTKKGENGEDVILYGEEGAYAYESRDLFFAGDDPDFVLVGIDATGIQNRCLIHWLIDTVGEELVAPFRDLALEGDIHKHNISVLGLANKAAAKKFYYCVPLDSRALTKKGWKGYDEVEVGELVLSYNAETGKQEWTPVLEKVYFDDAPIIEMGNSQYKVRSTPNHRWFTQPRKAKTKWIDTPVEIKTTEELSTMQNIIVNAQLQDTSGIEFDWMSLPKYGTDWTQVVLDMTQAQRRSFLAGFCIADGCMDDKGNWHWSQLNGELYEAALLASYLVHDGVLAVNTRTQENGNELKTVSLRNKPHVVTASFKYKDCTSQPVWCIRTKNESWVMRQGDIITITGNTLMMGGGGGRLAADQAQFGTKMTEAEGTAKKKKLVATIPGFSQLIKRKQKELAETGRIKLCDETPILVPSPHMVIPYLLQGDESRLMKRAMWYTDQEVRRHGLTDHVFKVADIHDEWQFKVRRKYVEKFVAATLPAFPRAGDSFSYLIPISGDAKVGDSWAKTH